MKRSLYKKQTITQKMRYREYLIKYVMKHGVTKTVLKYNINRQYVCRWLKRYDGIIRSLANISTKPHFNSKSHIDAMIKLILDMQKRNKDTGLIVFRVKLTNQCLVKKHLIIYKFCNY